MLFVLGLVAAIVVSLLWTQRSQERPDARVALTAEEVRLLGAAAALPRGEGPSQVCRRAPNKDGPVALVSLGSRGPREGANLRGLPNRLLQLYRDEHAAVRAVDQIALEADRSRTLGYDEGGMSLVSPVALRAGRLVLLLPHDAAPEDVIAHRGDLAGVATTASHNGRISAAVVDC
jgi:hypothetical protein